MITVYGRQSSSSVQLVMWAIAELQIRHERLDYGHGFKPTDTKDFLSMNPMGRIPVLKDGDLVLFESSAILRYLGNQYGNADFWPKNSAILAAYDMWAEWGKNTFTEAVLDIFVYDVRLPPETRDAAVLQQATNHLIPLAKVLDERLIENEWVGGDKFSFADISCGHILYRYFKLSWNRPTLPNLARYYEQLKTRAAFRDNVMISYESLRGSY